MSPTKAADAKKASSTLTSTDGINWRKPALGLIEFAGSRQNNIVMSRAAHGIHAGGVLKDPRDSRPRAPLQVRPPECARQTHGQLLFR